MVAVVPHGRRGGDPERPALGEDVDRLLRDRSPEGQVVQRQVGEERSKAGRVDDGARQAVLAQLAGLLEDADLDVPQPAPGLVVPAHEAGELDRTGEAGRPGAHEDHVHRNGLLVGAVGHEEAVARKRRLGVERSDRSAQHARALGHDHSDVAVHLDPHRPARVSNRPPSTRRAARGPSRSPGKIAKTGAGLYPDGRIGRRRG